MARKNQREEFEWYQISGRGCPPIYRFITGEEASHYREDGYTVSLVIQEDLDITNDLPCFSEDY